MAEFAKLRLQEEQQLKQAGNANWKQEAEGRFLARLTKLSQELRLDKENEIKRQHEINIEDGNKVVDDVFEFLKDLQTPKLKPKNPRNTPSFRVSKMISYLEEKSRSLKHIPSKLLSRPTTHYDSTTKLWTVTQTETQTTDHSSNRC